MKRKLATVLALSTFAGAGALCAVIGATYPVVIWGVGYAAVTHRKRQHVPSCPLMQAAATQERGR